MLISWFTGCMFEHPYGIGDGYCQDETNNEGCTYDGGDCCGLCWTKGRSSMAIAEDLGPTATATVAEV